MKAPAILVSTLMTAALVSTPASANTMSVQDAVSQMVDQLVATTANEIKTEVNEAVANAIYLFEPDASMAPGGAVKVTELTASKQSEKDPEDEQVQ
ncbi:hypothetical protein [Salinimonas chungwhensis]|uniref:hypothetical protein n=1 Tax=Salinimonas chungwhensis TaxID=265425 RepID=UPI000369096C|nr:hypothetical protein [Salinimonas chungwhensis]